MRGLDIGQKAKRWGGFSEGGGNKLSMVQKVQGALLGSFSILAMFEFNLSILFKNSKMKDLRFIGIADDVQVIKNFSSLPLSKGTPSFLYLVLDGVQFTIVFLGWNINCLRLLALIFFFFKIFDIFLESRPILGRKESLAGSILSETLKYSSKEILILVFALKV